jgi:hypothetical protein
MKSLRSWWTKAWRGECPVTAPRVVPVGDLVVLVGAVMVGLVVLALLV